MRGSFKLVPPRTVRLAQILACVLWSASSIAQDPMGGCIVEAAGHAKFDGLRTKMSLTGSKDQSFTMLVDKTFVTEEEKQTIVVWMSERESCWRTSVPWRENNLPPAIRSVAERIYTGGTRLVADLYVGKLSYGEYASKRSELAADQGRQWIETAELLRAGNRAEAERLEFARQQAELERQRRDSEQTRNQPQQQVQNQPQYKPYELPMFMQAPAPLKSPTTTTCETVANQVICRTQ